MKNYRIVRDDYAGYEAQVQYSLLPFIWFQMNAENSVNTWNTGEQAMEFIKQKKMGIYHKTKSAKETLVFQCEMEVKRLLSFGVFKLKNHVTWQEDRFNHQPQANMFQPAY